MCGKDADIPYRFYDLVVAVYFIEEPAQPGRRDLFHRSFTVDPAPGLFDGSFAEVCRKQLDRADGRLLAEILEKTDRNGVYFFTRGAGRNPDPDHLGRFFPL